MFNNVANAHAGHGVPGFLFLGACISCFFFFSVYAVRICVYFYDACTCVNMLPSTLLLLPFPPPSRDLSQSRHNDDDDSSLSFTLSHSLFISLLLCFFPRTVTHQWLRSIFFSSCSPILFFLFL